MRPTHTKRLNETVKRLNETWRDRQEGGCDLPFRLRLISKRRFAQDHFEHTRKESLPEKEVRSKHGSLPVDTKFRSRTPCLLTLSLGQHIYIYIVFLIKHFLHIWTKPPFRANLLWGEPPLFGVYCTWQNDRNHVTECVDTLMVPPANLRPSTKHRTLFFSTLQLQLLWLLTSRTVQLAPSPPFGSGGF